MKYTREVLLQLCIDAVVPFQKWSNRDSHCAQVLISDIYMGLASGIKYTTTVEGDKTIWIDFEKPTDEQRKDMSQYFLNTDSIDDYRNEFGYESEMFEGCGIDWNSNYLGGYLPTRKRLDEANGEDWY